MDTNLNFLKQLLQQNLPLVTIGVSSYNYSKYIEDALTSLLTQTYKNIELIIIDDCSSDNCPQKIEKWIRENNVDCTYIHHEKNLGITKTSNEFVKLAKGKYITLFATDDIMLPERIERQVKILEAAGEEYGMCYALPELIDEEDNPIEQWRKKFFTVCEGDVLAEYVKRSFWFNTPTTLIRTSVYAKIGLYDERVLIEDYNFFIRLVACYKVKYCDYPCIQYRLKKQSGIFNQWKKNNYERYFYDRILSNFQALKFIKRNKERTYIKEKITQYLKCLALYNSRYFLKVSFYLIRNRYLKIPPKLFLIKSAIVLGFMRASSIKEDQAI